MFFGATDTVWHTFTATAMIMRIRLTSTVHSTSEELVLELAKSFLTEVVLNHERFDEDKQDDIEEQCPRQHTSTRPHPHHSILPHAQTFSAHFALIDEEIENTSQGFCKHSGVLHSVLRKTIHICRKRSLERFCKCFGKRFRPSERNSYPLQTSFFFVAIGVPYC